MAKDPIVCADLSLKRKLDITKMYKRDVSYGIVVAGNELPAFRLMKHIYHGLPTRSPESLEAYPGLHLRKLTNDIEPGNAEKKKFQGCSR